MLDGIDEKTKMTVEDVLETKHHKSHPVLINDTLQHDIRHEILKMLATSDSVESVAKSLSGSAGINRIDSSSIARVFLKYERSGAELRKSIAKSFIWITISYLLNIRKGLCSSAGLKCQKNVQVFDQQVLQE